MHTIVEIVMFHVKPHKQEEFWEAMKEWVAHIKEQPGFVSYSYMRSVNDPGVLVQILEFHYKFVAQDVLKKYQQKIGDKRFYRFFHSLHQKPEIEYYEKIDFMEEPPTGETPDPQQDSAAQGQDSAAQGQDSAAQDQGSAAQNQDSAAQGQDSRK